MKAEDLTLRGEESTAVKDEQMPFEGRPDEKDGDGSVEAVVNEPPDETDACRWRKRTAVTRSPAVQIQGIVHEQDDETEEEKDDHHMVVDLLAQASIEDQMVEQIQRADERGNTQDKVRPELHLCGWNEDVLLVIVIVGVGGILCFIVGHVHGGDEWLHAGRSVAAVVVGDDDRIHSLPNLGVDCLNGRKSRTRGNKTG